MNESNNNIFYGKVSRTAASANAFASGFFPPVTPGPEVPSDPTHDVFRRATQGFDSEDQAFRAEYER